MKIELKFDIRDKAFVFVDDKIYPCVVEEIEWEKDEEGVSQIYTVCYEKTKGLFDTSKHIYTTSAEKLFLSKADAKEFLDKLEEARNLVNSVGIKPRPFDITDYNSFCWTGIKGLE